MEIPIATVQLNELLESVRLLTAGRLADAEAILRRIVVPASISNWPTIQKICRASCAALRLALDLADTCCQRGDALYNTQLNQAAS